MQDVTSYKPTQGISIANFPMDNIHVDNLQYVNGVGMVKYDVALTNSTFTNITQITV